jgi:hypothetical protein
MALHPSGDALADGVGLVLGGVVTGGTDALDLQADDGVAGPLLDLSAHEAT